MYYKKFTLDNGIRCTYISKRDVGISCIYITIKAGSKNELPEQAGISHVLEHMFFKGTKKYPSNIDITSNIESLGGHINAHTTVDTTTYEIKIASKHIKTAIEILSEILLHSLFRKKDIEYEKNVVLEEYKGLQDDEYHILGTEFQSSIFKDYPLKNSIIGTIETIGHTSRSALLDYKNKYYTADNMFITISSNISFERIKKMCRQSNFSKFVSTDLKKNVPFRYIPNETPTVTTVYKDTTQEKIIIGFPICSASHKDVSILYAISSLLTANMSSRLFIALREKNPLVYSIDSDAEFYQDMGVFRIQTEADINNIFDIDNTLIDSAGEFLQSIFGNTKHYDRKTEKGVLSVILDTIRDLQRNIISKEELHAVKQGMGGAFLLSSESSETVVHHYEKEAIYNYDNINSIKQTVKKIEKIKAKDILRVCNKYFTKKTMFITVLGKSKQSTIEQYVANYKDF